MKYSLTILLLLFSINIFSQKLNVYLIPGMGTDHHVFHNFKFDTTKVNPVKIKWQDFDKCTGLDEYAKLLTRQIDTTEAFSIVGVSMGGMLAMEMAQLISPKSVVLISSVQSSDDLPFKVKLAKIFPIYKLLGRMSFEFIAKNKKTYKEIDDPRDKLIYREMMENTGVDFYKWQIHSIVNWQFEEKDHNFPILHIHGSRDKTLPLKNVNADITIDQGTHKLTINQSDLLIQYFETFLLK